MRRSLTPLLLALAATASGFISGGADPAASVSTRRPKVITLERTRCFGTCPAYKLTIFSDGRVEYLGKDFVKRKGQATSRITTKQLEELVMEFTNIYYFNLPASIEPGSKHCPQAATDHPSATTSLTWQGRSHSISHYHGCRGSEMLQLLRKLEDKIDETVNVGQWIK